MTVSDSKEFIPRRLRVLLGRLGEVQEQQQQQQGGLQLGLVAEEGRGLDGGAEGDLRLCGSAPERRAAPRVRLRRAQGQG